MAGAWLGQLCAIVAVLAFTTLPSNAQIATACTEEGGSDRCACALPVVVCDLIEAVAVPSAIPTSVTDLSLYGNKITRLSVFSFANPFTGDLDELRRLSIRNNELERMDADAFRKQTKLQELYMNENFLTAIPAGVLSPLTQLKVLHLGSNQLTSINPLVLNDLTSLEELYLGDNRITTLAPNVFQALTNLRVLHLQRNSIPSLPEGLFNTTTKLEEVYLSVNDITRIPQGMFDNLPNLKAVEINGNPSSCFWKSNALTCNCEIGYSGDGTFCEARDCGPRIQDLHQNASATCTGNTRFGGDSCTASCNPGYNGGSSTFTCNSDGEWEGELECTPVDCTSTIAGLDPNADADCTDTLFDGSGCLASCNPGYNGGSTRFTCGTDGQWKGSLTCERLSCGTQIQEPPRNTRPQLCTSTLFGASCPVSCDSGYVGPDNATFTCGEDGLWEGSLVCLGRECGREIDNLPAEATARCRGDTAFGGDDCVVSCKAGFVGDEQPYQCDSDGKWRPRSRRITCSRQSCGATIQDLPAESHYVSSCDDNLFGDSCNAFCEAGYIGEEVPFDCGADGYWLGDRSRSCTPRDCGPEIVDLDPHASARCTGDTRFGGDSCQATCNSGFLGGSATFTCGRSGLWQGDLTCTAVDCGKLDASVFDELDCMGTNFGSVCIASCSDGSTANFTCGSDGVWDGGLTCLSESSSSLDAGTIVGMTVGIIVIIALIIILVLLVVSRRNDKKISQLQRRATMTKAHRHTSRKRSNSMFSNPLAAKNDVMAPANGLFDSSAQSSQPRYAPSYGGVAYTRENSKNQDQVMYAVPMADDDEAGAVTITSFPALAGQSGSDDAKKSTLRSKEDKAASDAVMLGGFNIPLADEPQQVEEKKVTLRKRDAPKPDQGAVLFEGFNIPMSES